MSGLGAREVGASLDCELQRSLCRKVCPPQEWSIAFMKPIRYAAVALTSATLLLFLAGCASKNYVRTQTAPLAQKTNELDDATAANNRSVHELDTRTTNGINQAKGAAGIAD